MPMSDLEDKRAFNFTDIRKFEIVNATGHKVGHVREIFVDPNTLEPCFALLHYEKFLDRNTKSYLVPWSELRIGDQSVQTRPALGHHDEAEAEMGESAGTRMASATGTAAGGDR